MLIYRVEKNGHGPYNRKYETEINEYQFYLNLDLAHSDDPKSHPNPIMDGINIPINFGFIQDPNFVCGFSSMQQFLEWFGIQSRSILATAGYSLIRFEIDEKFVYSGAHQVMFYKQEATYLDQKCITTFME
jgi:hypothetical protein